MFGQFEFQKMRSTAHAGVVGANEFFTLVFQGFLVQIEIGLNKGMEIVFDVDLVLAGGNNDFVAVDNFIDNMGGVIENATRGFDETNAVAGVA